MKNVSISRDRQPRRARGNRLERAECAEPAKSRSKKSARAASPIALLTEHFADIMWPVTFTYFNPGAREVFLAGDFNEWDARRNPMSKLENGSWKIELNLKPGSYEYRLIVDGAWQEDSMAERFATNPFGGLNSIRIVPG